MNCPHKDSFMPRCQITTHPDRENIEYCRVCGEWRRISDVGEIVPNTFWTITGSVVLMMVFVAIVNQQSAPQPSREQYYPEHTSQP